MHNPLVDRARLLTEGVSRRVLEMARQAAIAEATKAAAGQSGAIQVRVLLDNCVPWRLAKSIGAHKVASVPGLGWAHLTNGRLLDAMAGRFDALVTVDKAFDFSSG